MVGDRPVGGDHLVAAQTMTKTKTKTKTHDVPGTLAQIHAAQAKGVDIIRGGLKRRVLIPSTPTSRPSTTGSRTSAFTTST
jgi:4-hydroxy-3-methylbut-2-en-1-yl diphosphate synthase IspG/GcpE